VNNDGSQQPPEPHAPSDVLIECDDASTCLATDRILRGPDNQSLDLIDHIIRSYSEFNRGVVEGVSMASGVRLRDFLRARSAYICPHFASFCCHSSDCVDFDYIRPCEDCRGMTQAAAAMTAKIAPAMNPTYAPPSRTCSKSATPIASMAHRLYSPMVFSEGVVHILMDAVSVQLEAGTSGSRTSIVLSARTSLGGGFHFALICDDACLQAPIAPQT